MRVGSVEWVGGAWTLGGELREINKTFRMFCDSFVQSMRGRRQTSNVPESFHQACSSSEGGGKSMAATPFVIRDSLSSSFSAGEWTRMSLRISFRSVARFAWSIVRIRARRTA